MRQTVKKMVDKVPYVDRKLAQIRDLKTDIGVLQLEKGDLEAKVRKLTELNSNIRALLATRFIRGNGIEIGATYLPTKLPSRTKVRYVDEALNSELLKRYPDLKGHDLAPVSIVDNAEKLSAFKGGSLDFIIANHFLEHCQDPLGTIINMSKKLTAKGTLFFAIPDKRYTFDRQRPVTPFKHLLLEHRKPTSEMRFRHFKEASELLEHKKGSAIESRAKELMAIGYSIHYHVWRQQDMMEMFIRLIEGFKLDLEIKAMVASGNEVIFILRKAV